ncbi:hypothetical protein PVL29_010015 [Vitis rotundifolia]|uniref:Uncharacterized protein n=1 Tax=Vitis rotundifolia TaxID=103349 RepID=A0AA38ZS56_VITRO|nr:hypothetical protein PVL29_010015 [Vitis rotundifolia]
MEPLYFRLWNNLFQRAQHLFILLITYLLQQQLQPNSCHTILSFIVAVLASFLAVKYAGKVTSPFETHPKTMQFAIGSLLVYCLAYGAQQRFSAALHSPAYVNALCRCMELSGFLSVASLASLFFPDSVQWMFFVLYTIFWMGGLLCTLLQMLWKWIHQVDGTEHVGALPIQERVLAEINGDEETTFSAN